MPNTMLPNDLDHCANGYPVHTNPNSSAETVWSEATSRSAEIIRWLPLLAANDFLEQHDSLPPVA